MKPLFKNLKFRLLLALFFIFIVFFYSFGSSVIYSMKKAQERSMEASLTAYAKDLQHDYYEKSIKGEKIDFEEMKKELDEIKEEFDIPLLYAQISSYKIASKDHNIIAQSRDLKGETLKLSHSLLQKIIERPEQIYFSEMRNSELTKNKIRIGTIFIGNYENHMIILQCAMPYDKRTPEIEEMKITLWIGLSILLTVVLFFASFFISTSLKNVQDVTNAAKKISIQDSHTIIPKTHIAYEIDDLIETFNILLQDLQQAYSQVKQFGQNASHELKTPLTIIQGEIEVGLRKERTSEEYHKILKKVAKEVHTLHEVIEKILFLSSNTKNELTKHFSEVYVDEVLLESISEKNAMAEQNNIQLVIDILEPLSIQSNAILLKMVFTNLIDNAIKYAFKGSCVHLSLSTNRFCITNEGVHIDTKEIQQLFEPFYRGKEGKENAKGSGLGLAIVKNILDLHHAKITLEQEALNKTIITIFFQ